MSSFTVRIGTAQSDIPRRLAYSVFHEFSEGLKGNTVRAIVPVLMKKDIHPADYRQVVFVDLASGMQFLVGSTIATTETIQFEGKEYPKAIVEISSASHPFYTGEDRTLDKTGRVEKFKQRAAAAKKK